MYKLVAVDMDGTLLSENKTISDANLRAIKKAKAKGVKVVLATGRPVKGIQRYLKELNLVDEGDYAVAFNGAVVQKTDTGEIIAETLMSIDDIHYLYDLSKKLHVNIHALTPHSCITPKVSKYSEVESSINKIPLDIVNFDTIPKDTTIVKIMFIDEPEILDRVISELPKEIYKKYTIVRSCPYFLEFLNLEANKGSGVELLAKTLDIKPEEIICIGDAGNDIHMIKYAGLGVAMGNAFPEVKEIADYITKTNNDDGVAHVIDKFVLAN